MTANRLFKYDWRNLRADRAPSVAAVVLSITIAYGAFNGSQWVRFQNRAIDAALSEERARLGRVRAEIGLIESGTKQVAAFSDPRLPQSLGRTIGLRYAVMPPAALASLAVGQSDLYPYYFKVSTNTRQTFLNSDEIENPVHLLAGRFDLAFVILYLFPLVILAFSYNLVSADKEDGILALTLSQPVALQRIVLAKVAVRAAFVLALALLLAVAGVVLGGADLAKDGAILRLLLWIGVTTAYGAFWFALAVGVNSLGRSSATNAVALAGLWLLFVVLVPSVLNVAVKAAYPVPSRVEMIQVMRVAGDDATRKGSQLLAQYMEDHPELSAAGSGTAGDFGALQLAVTEATERSIQPVIDGFDSQVAGQQRIVDRFRYLSPAIVAQSAFNDLAGAGANRYSYFLVQVTHYHSQWREFFNSRILRKEKLSVADIDRLPAFRFQEEKTGDVAARLLIALVGLIVPAVLVAGASLSRLRRYPVAS